jgi:hemerythrin
MMVMITWNDSLSVKVKEIDLQHQKLIDMINELNEAMKKGKGKESLAKIINGLVSYTATHFKQEERYFDKFGYPDTVNHKKEHVAFVQKVTDFKNGFEKNNLSVTVEVMNFLSDWLKNHIKGTDKKYSAFFNEKGLS